MLATIICTLMVTVFTAELSVTVPVYVPGLLPLAFVVILMVPGVLPVLGLVLIQVWLSLADQLIAPPAKSFTSSVTVRLLPVCTISETFD